MVVAGFRNSRAGIECRVMLRVPIPSKRNNQVGCGKLEENEDCQEPYDLLEATMRCRDF